MFLLYYIMNKFIILILFIALIYLAYNYRHDIIRGGISYLPPSYNNVQWMTDLYHIELMAVKGKKLKEIISGLSGDEILNYVDEEDYIKTKYSFDSFAIPRHWLLNTNTGDEKIDTKSYNRSIDFALFNTETKGFRDEFKDNKFYVIVGHKYEKDDKWYGYNHIFSRFKTWELLKPADREILYKNFKDDYDTNKLYNNVKKYNPGLFVNSGRNKNDIANKYRIGMDSSNIPDWWKNAVETPRPKNILTTIEGYNKFMNYAENLKINIDVAERIPSTNFYTNKDAIGIVRMFLIEDKTQLYPPNGFTSLEYPSYIGKIENIGQDLRSRIIASEKTMLEIFVKAVIQLSGQSSTDELIIHYEDVETLPWYKSRTIVEQYNHKQKYGEGVANEEKKESLLTWLLRNTLLPYFMIHNELYKNYNSLYETPDWIPESMNPNDLWQTWTFRALGTGITFYRILDQYIPMEVRTNHTPTDTILYRHIEPNINILRQYYDFLKDNDDSFKGNYKVGSLLRAVKKFDKEGPPILFIQLFSRFKIINFKNNKEFMPLIKHKDIESELDSIFPKDIVDKILDFIPKPEYI